MARINKLMQSSPYPVEQTLRRLGQNLRVARVRRNMTIAEAAERIGTGPRAVMDAEKGKASTSIAVYTALLWLFDQLEQLNEVGEPSRDKEGEALALARGRKRARKVQEIDNDF
jgi:transcriptional regulator with XRE-family HTH domain